MECPRCDGQGNVYQAIISDTEEILYICDECEASWKDIINIQFESFIDLTHYLKSKGIEYHNLKLSEVDYNI